MRLLLKQGIRNAGNYGFLSKISKGWLAGKNRVRRVHKVSIVDVNKTME